MLVGFEPRDIQDIGARPGLLRPRERLPRRQEQGIDAVRDGHRGARRDQPLDMRAGEIGDEDRQVRLPHAAQHLAFQHQVAQLVQAHRHGGKRDIVERQHVAKHRHGSTPGGDGRVDEAGGTEQYVGAGCAQDAGQLRAFPPGAHQRVGHRQPRAPARDARIVGQVEIVLHEHQQLDRPVRQAREQVADIGLSAADPRCVGIDDDFHGKRSQGIGFGREECAALGWPTVSALR